MAAGTPPLTPLEVISPPPANFTTIIASKTQTPSEASGFATFTNNHKAVTQSGMPSCPRTPIYKQRFNYISE